MCNDWTEDDIAFLFNQRGLENILWHWFFQATIENEAEPWDCIITYIFRDTGSHCSATRDIWADLLDVNHLNMMVIWDWLEANSTWMHEEPKQAFRDHWDMCFPDMNQIIADNNYTAAETGSEFIRQLNPSVLP